MIVQSGDGGVAVADVFDDVGDNPMSVEFPDHDVVHAVSTGVTLDVGVVGKVEGAWKQGDGDD